MKTILLLICSNVFMTFAWYGHLKHMQSPLIVAIVASWGIAFFEYCFQVPANRLGYGEFTGYQLKMIQEIITLTVFICFATFYLKEKFRWNYAAGFVCLAAAGFFMFMFDPPASSAAVGPAPDRESATVAAGDLQAPVAAATRELQAGDASAE